MLTKTTQAPLPQNKHEGNMKKITIILVIILAAILYTAMRGSIAPDCSKLLNGDSAAQEMYVTYCK